MNQSELVCKKKNTFLERLCSSYQPSICMKISFFNEQLRVSLFLGELHFLNKRLPHFGVMQKQ